MGSSPLGSYEIWLGFYEDTSLMTILTLVQNLANGELNNGIL